MKFKLWIESMLTQSKAKTYVLDALDAGSMDDDEKTALLSSPINIRADIADKLTDYSELRPYASKIAGFVHANPKKSIQQLIHFISELDNIEPRVKKDMDHPMDQMNRIDQKSNDSLTSTL